MAIQLRIPVVILVLLAAAGCAEPPEAPLAVVRGRVTFRGSPMPGGSIVFTPDDETGGRGASAIGSIGPEGRYSLMTGGVPGASTGKHRVTIAGPDGWPLPDKFLDPQLSGLKAEVVAGRENVVDFKLEER